MKRSSALIALIILAACSNNAQTSSKTNSVTGNAAATAPGPKRMSSANGSMVYGTNCSTCHSSDGKGSPGAFPPLAGNPVVNGDATKVIHIVKNGLSGTIKINGATYAGQMPAWKGTLTNDQIASVISYVRASWGNTGGPVTSAQVAAVK